MNNSYYITLTIIFACGIVALSIYSGTKLADGVTISTYQESQEYPDNTSIATESADLYTEEDEEGTLEQMRYVSE